MLGVISNIILMMVIVFELFTNDNVVQNINKNFESAKLLIVEWDSTIETIPFIVFLYMYQGIIPQYYKELRNRSLKKMDKILLKGSSMMITIYFFVGFFGYITFADKLDTSLLDPKTNGNILE
jgi:amino acid permease